MESKHQSQRAVERIKRQRVAGSAGVVEVLLLVALAISGLSFQAHAQTTSGAAEPKTEAKSELNDEEAGRRATLVVRKMLASVRLKKFDRALQYVGLDEMGAYLLADNYQKLTAAQKTKLSTLLGEYIKKRGFPLAVKYLGSVGLSYDKPTFEQGHVHIRSSVVYSGSERLVFTWVLARRDSGEYVVVDFRDAKGDSSMTKSRDKQILPVYKQRGADGLLKTLEGVIARL